MSAKPSFFAELKRRNVIRAAGLYLVGAWLLVQVAGTVLPMFGAPDWLPRSIVIILAIAFVPAVIFSWVFELTPQGLKRDEDVAPEQSIGPQTGRRMDRTIIAVLVLALGYFAVDKFVLGPKREMVFRKGAESHVQPNESDINPKSIAVLPFENLSSDKDNAYFAEGIQDEILTRLAKIGALKVISRTSTSHYASSPQNLPEIARQLAVANILEGSVQKAANAVHVNVQLIRAATDEHLWAESYNRKLDDIFGVEGEVAGAIADQLKATLTGNEKNALAAKPTTNPAAYDAYLRGIAFAGRVDSLYQNNLNAIQAFEEAIRLDSNFALAWAQLSRQESFAINLPDRSPERLAAARHALEMAMKLGTDLVETKISEGFYHYWVERDYKSANAIFESLRQAYPNNSDVPYALAAIARRENRWEDSRRLFADAIAINPQDTFLLVDASLTDIAQRDSAAALKVLAKAHDISPKNSAVIAFQATCHQLNGDIAGAQSILDQIRPDEGDDNFINVAVNNATLARNYTPTIALLKAQLENPQALRSSLGNFYNMLGDLQRLSGDSASATVNYQAALKFFQSTLRNQPDNASLFAGSATAEAGLGNKAAALADARRAVELLPASKDAWIGSENEEALARIEARFGDKENAIAAVQHLLAISYGLPPITPATLRLDPDWDNLRGDPRFEKLCQEPNK